MRPAQWAYQLGRREWNQLHKLLRKQAGKRLGTPEERHKEGKEVASCWNQQCLYNEWKKIIHHPAHRSAAFSLWCRSMEHPWAIFFLFIYLFRKLCSLVGLPFGNLHFGDISSPWKLQRILSLQEAAVITVTMVSWSFPKSASSDLPALGEALQGEMQELKTKDADSCAQLAHKAMTRKKMARPWVLLKESYFSLGPGRWLPACSHCALPSSQCASHNHTCPCPLFGLGFSTWNLHNHHFIEFSLGRKALSSYTRHISLLDNTPAHLYSYSSLYLIHIFLFSFNPSKSGHPHSIYYRQLSFLPPLFLSLFFFLLHKTTVHTVKKKNKRGLFFALWWRVSLWARRF